VALTDAELAALRKTKNDPARRERVAAIQTNALDVGDARPSSTTTCSAACRRRSASSADSSLGRPPPGIHHQLLAIGAHVRDRHTAPVRKPAMFGRKHAPSP
jgi:hypothetical protein